MYSSNRTPSDVTRLGLNWYSWDWPLLHHCCCCCCQANRVWRHKNGSQSIICGTGLFLAFVRRRNIKVQPPAAGKFENYDWPWLGQNPKLGKIWNCRTIQTTTSYPKSKFEIAEPFKQLRAIQKCNRNDVFPYIRSKIIMKRCARRNGPVASKPKHLNLAPDSNFIRIPIGLTCWGQH